MCFMQLPGVVGACCILLPGLPIMLYVMSMCFLLCAGPSDSNLQAVA